MYLFRKLCMHQHIYLIWGANLPPSKKSKCIQSITLKIFNISKHNAINFFFSIKTVQKH